MKRKANLGSGRSVTLISHMQGRAVITPEASSKIKREMTLAVYLRNAARCAFAARPLQKRNSTSRAVVT